MDWDFVYSMFSSMYPLAKLILGLGVFSMIALLIIIEIVGRRKNNRADFLSELATSYYANGNPELGMGPEHPDGHGNKCDCWSCWSQTHGP